MRQMLLFVPTLIRMRKFKPSMLGTSHALRVMRGISTTTTTKGRIIASEDLSGNKPIDPEKPLPIYTYIIYTQFPPDAPNFYWCDEFGNVESPPVLAEAYDGTTALRDGLAVVVSGVFYA